VKFINAGILVLPVILVSMAQSLKQELKRHRLLLIAFGVSVVLLTIFLIFQYNDLKILNLDIKWVILSGIPVLIGLFIGGYIKSFKGFGLELESNLKEPIPMSIVSKIDITESPEMNKESLPRLHSLTDVERNKINRLRFIYGKRGYYDSYAVQEHNQQLRNLKFIEIVNQEGEFLYLLSSSKLKGKNTEQENNYEKANEFIRAVEHEKIPETYSEVVTDHLTTSDNLIQAYRKINKSVQSKFLSSKREMLPILDDTERMIGIVDKHNLETKIAEEVEKTID
jgi:hypothetical protein